MEMVRCTGKEAYLKSIRQASVMATNKDNTLQVLWERDGDAILCIVKKYGSKTNPEEAIRLSISEYRNAFKKCLNEKWLFQFFNSRRIITWR
jgi:hypothetical protein